MSRTSVQKTRRRWLAVGLGLAAGVLIVAVLALLMRYRAGNSATPAPTASADFYQGTRLDDQPAPEFRLLDQRGTAVSLADMRGKVVVITLLDPYCTDICPLYAYQFRLAHQALGQDAANVALLAFNANNKKTSVEDVLGATRKWAMEEIPTWHFLTGSPEELKAVWDGYRLHASGRPKPDKPAELEHSPGVFIIDPAGRRRWYISTNFEGAPPLHTLIVNHAQTLLCERR